MLKVIHPDEAEQRLDFQSRLLDHVSRVHPDLPVPRVIKRKPAGTVADDFHLQCLTFLDGTPLHLSAMSANLRRSVGNFQAKLSIALQEFHHPAENLKILWDTKCLANFSDLADSIENVGRRALVNTVIAQFEANVVPLLPSLRQQVIHNDFNRDNILIDGEQIAGLIDFGDIVRSPIVQDVATTCAYLGNSDDSFVEAIGDIVVGFHEVFPLHHQEVSVLLDFIMARLALIVVIGAYKARLNPGNAEYLLRNQQDAIRMLSHLIKQNRAETAELLASRLSEVA
ncbi:MAG: phosphotransferase [Pseudorhodoplanes sp.]